MWRVLGLSGGVARDRKEPYDALLLAVPRHVSGNIAFPYASQTLCINVPAPSSAACFS